MDKGIRKSFKDLRINAGLTHEEVALQCEITTSHYTRIEKGEITPSEEEIVRISSFFDVTVEQLVEDIESREGSLKNKFNIFHVVQSVLLLLCFFLPFNQTDDNWSGPATRTGFDLLKVRDFEIHFAVKMVFALILIQLIIYLVSLIKHTNISNVYKAATILTNVLIGVILYIDLQSSLGDAPTMILIVLLVVFGIILNIYELIKYDQGHDFLSDTFKMRKVVLATIVLIYLMFLIRNYEYFFVDFYKMDSIEKVFLILWIIYLIVFPFLRQSFYEKRIWVSLYILFAPLTLLILLLNYGEFDSSVVFIVLMMTLPIIIVNSDFITTIIKDFLRSNQRKLK